MADPSRSWALVVGIDRYDDAIVPPLDGAAADAVAAVNWLRGLGVPGNQILLHAVSQPVTAPAIAALGLPNASADATFDALDASLVRLSGESGDRLYVFLAGHAVYEPSEGRLFLCQDFADSGTRSARTLGIDALIRYLLSYPFREQFLFMDGCQNFSYSPAVRRRFRTILDGTTVTPDEANNGLLTVFGASMGELAQERNGRGAFFGTLFPVLDPGLLASMPPQQGLGAAITLDFRTGESLVDLEELVTWAREALQAAGVTQTPSCGKYGRAAAGTMPLLRLPPAGASEVVLELLPPEGAAEVSEVIVTVDDVQGRRRQPAVGMTAVPFPDEFRIPSGASATVTCRAKAGSAVVPPWERVSATGTQIRIKFIVEPVQARRAARALPAGIRVNVRESSGRLASVMEPTIYREMQSRLGPVPGENISLVDHESGPEFRVAGVEEKDQARAVELASSWYAELDRRFSPGGYTIATAGLALRPAAIRVRLPAGVTAEELAGPGQYRSLVVVRALGESPADPVSHELPVGSVDGQEVELPPGPATVGLTLPWGSWSQVVNVPASGIAEVTLPGVIGTPPLRVGLFRESQAGGRRIFGAGNWSGGPPAGVTVEPGGKKGADLDAIPAPENAVWALEAPGAAPLVRLEGAVPLLFPLFARRNFAVAGGAQPRVEPLSDVDSPEWDLLVGSGRLEDLDPEAAVRLTDDKWFDELLGLAGAYAIYALMPRDPARLRGYLGTVLSNLSNRVGHDSPDVRLLDLYLRASDAGATSKPSPELEYLADGRAIPLFRWGIPLALDLLGRVERKSAAAARWEQQLSELDRGVSLASAWTVVSGVAAGKG